MKPTLENVSYGPHERHVIDVYKASSVESSPIFIWIHGGAFCFGDKTQRAEQYSDHLTELGITLVSINYRFSYSAVYPGPFHDCRRALQFVRYNAPSWGLDPDRIAMGGMSAGAIMSLWLAFRPDMADPSSKDPIERQSTRPACVYFDSGPTSLDPRFIAKTMGGRTHLAYGLAQLFGVDRDTWPDLDEPKQRLVEDASPINYLDSSAPPVFAQFELSREPVTDEDEPEKGIHHPQFGDDLKKRMDALNIECTVVVDEGLQTEEEDAMRRAKTNMGKFLTQHLRVKT